MRQDRDRDRDEKGRYTSEIDDETVLKALGKDRGAATPRTAKQVADQLGITVPGAHKRLNKLADEDRVTKHKLGENTVVWTPSRMLRVVQDPDVLHDQPRIDGTRISVFVIGESIREGDLAIEDVLREYPDLSWNDVEAALDYYDNHPNEMADLREERTAVVDQIDRLRREREQNREQERQTPPDA